MSQSSSCIWLYGMETRNTPNKITTIKISQVFPQQQIHSADSNLHLFCIVHLPTAPLFLQPQVPAWHAPWLPCTALRRTQCWGQRPTLPCSIPVCRKVHTQQQNSELPCSTGMWQPSAATKEATKICLGLAGCLQGFGVQPRVLSH